MHQTDNELECRARELIAYFDTVPAIEESLPFGARLNQTYLAMVDGAIY